MRVCIVNVATNIVENVGVMGEGPSQPLTPPPGYLWVFDENAGRGWTYNGTALVPPPATPAPPPIDFSNVDNVEKALKALGLVCAAWNGKTPAQLKAAFKTAWDSLP